MQKTIVLNKTGYEPFFDFIKAYAILAVLLGHTSPYLDETGYFLWYGMQVPMFILIQVFHLFKSENYQFSFAKLFWRILFPFFLIQCLSFVLNILRGERISGLLGEYFYGFGYGPGSYFPFVYLQITLVALLVKPFINKISPPVLLIATVAICEGFEVISSLSNLPDFIYRVLAIRYLFLIYLGWIWVKCGIVINIKTIILSLISMATIVYFEYFYMPTEPWFYDTGWKTHRWPCYYYVSTMLCGILYWVYTLAKNNQLLTKSIKILSKCSYEIFLLQMVAVPFMPRLSFINNYMLAGVLRVFAIWTFSIVGGYYFNRLYNSIIKK